MYIERKHSKKCLFRNCGSFVCTGVLCAQCVIQQPMERHTENNRLCMALCTGPAVHASAAAWVSGPTQLP